MMNNKCVSLNFRDNVRGLHVDIFKVPTCCSCHLIGYKEAFPPLGSPSNSIAGVSTSKIRPIDYDAFSSSSNRNSQYSTLNGSDDEVEEEEEDDSSNIAYQFGNGFKRLKPLKAPVSTLIPDFIEGSKNRQSLFNRNQPETFLTPPANNPDTNFPFSNTGTSRRRNPTLKRKQFDQNTSGSDLKVSRVTAFPPKVYSQSERPRKVTIPISSTIDTKSVNLRLPNAHTGDHKRINYNYHPIIDFFENEEPQKNSLDHKTGKLVADDNNWKPMVAG